MGAVMLGMLSHGRMVHAQNADRDPNEAAFRHITNRLMCQCGGCSYLVLSCNHVNCSSATYISKSVRSALEEGQTEEMILASLADMYGPQVLAEPPREGFNWLGWIMPYVALLLGGGAVAFVIWRWKASPAEGLIQKGAAGRPRPAGMAPEQAAKLVDKYQSEIDRELARD
jgi:cytochrome c-type biogenesis protein CcmH/NrfF